MFTNVEVLMLLQEPSAAISRIAPFVPEPAFPPVEVIYTGIELFDPLVQFVFQLAIGKLKVPSTALVVVL
jgi:hypothetical protein